MNAFKEFLRDNWGLKLTSVCLAIMLWLVVRGDPSTERNITLPLEIRNIPRNMEITSNRPSTVEATVRGTFSEVWFAQSAPTCVIDLQSSAEGERIMPLGPENVQLPRTAGFDVISVRPPRVRLILEKNLSREVPIVAVTEGVPAQGFEVYSKTVIPPSTVITGPRSHVEKIRQIATETIALRDLKEAVRNFVNLNIQDPMVHSSTVRPVEVHVEVGVRRRVLTLTQVPVIPDDLALIVTPSRITLQIWIPAGFKGNLSRNDVTVSVSSRAIGSTVGQMQVPPEVTFNTQQDPAVKIKEISPSTVNVRRSGKS